MRANAVCGAVSAVLLLLLAAAGCGDPVAPQVIVGTTVIVQNRLLTPVDVTVNGVAVGAIASGQQRTIRRGLLERVVVEWESQRPQFEGRVVGDTLGARFERDVAGDGAELVFEIDNVIASNGQPATFYAPVVSNATAAPIVVGLNMDTPREVRLGTIEPGGVRSFVGYYRLGAGTSVRAYRPDVAYGPMLFVERAYGHSFDETMIDEGSGELSVSFDSDPP